MNTSKLTLAQQCKAFADAAEHNNQKRLLKISVLADQMIRRKDTTNTRKAIANHEMYYFIFIAEARRLQAVLNAQREQQSSRG